MGSFLGFIIKYATLFLFLALQGVAMALIFSFNTPQSRVYSSWIEDSVGSTQEFANYWRNYFHLQTVNDSLLAENARLHEALPTSKWLDSARTILKVDTLYKQKLEFQPCDVVNNYVHMQDNFLTLSAGSNKGVAKHMGVMNYAGIIGITVGVSNNYCVALSALHKDFTVSALLEGLNEIGSISWDGKSRNHVIMKEIPRRVALSKGMNVSVSQNSDLFPRGTPIGIVEEFTVTPGENTWTIKVRLHNDMRNIQKAMVVKNITATEQRQLESEVKKEYSTTPQGTR